MQDDSLCLLGHSTVTLCNCLPFCPTWHPTVFPCSHVVLHGPLRYFFATMLSFLAPFSTIFLWLWRVFDKQVQLHEPNLAPDTATNPIPRIVSLKCLRSLVSDTIGFVINCCKRSCTPMPTLLVTKIFFLTITEKIQADISYNYHLIYNYSQILHYRFVRSRPRKELTSDHSGHRLSCQSYS